MTQSTSSTNREAIYKKILDCSFIVHTELGPGLLENANLDCWLISTSNHLDMVLKEYYFKRSILCG